MKFRTLTSQRFIRLSPASGARPTQLRRSKSKSEKSCPISLPTHHARADHSCRHLDQRWKLLSEACELSDHSRLSLESTEQVSSYPSGTMSKSTSLVGSFAKCNPHKVLVHESEVVLNRYPKPTSVFAEQIASGLVSLRNYLSHLTCTSRLWVQRPERVL